MSRSFSGPRVSWGVVRICPTCKQVLNRRTGGRYRRYCSNACKQKAYRARRTQKRKAFVTPGVTEVVDGL